jgi:HK97 family phage prohead protease
MGGLQRLQADVEYKAIGDAGEVEGLASVFGNVDQVGDVVMPGAFAKTIQRWKSATQPMPLIADHSLTTDGLIGSVKDLGERKAGLWFRAGFSRSEKAQRIRQDILDGHLRGTSFTYEALRHRPGRQDGKAVRFLEELRLFEITLNPFPINELAGVTGAKASTTPWGNFTAADYTPEQYRRACLIDTGEGDVDSKDRYKLPVREPGGALNVGGVHAAAGALAGARGGLSVSADQKRAAARKLIRLYGEIGEEPPDSLRSLAGSGSASFDQWLEAMGHAVLIGDRYARKAAVDELVSAYPLDISVPVLGQEDAPEAPTGNDAPASSGPSTPNPAPAYGLAYLNEKYPPDGAPPEDSPQSAPLGVIARLDAERERAEIDALQADITRAMEA